LTGIGDESARRALFGLVTGYRLTQAVYVAARLGIADRLSGGPQEVDDLARAVGARPDPLFRVLRVLAAHGVFTLDGRRRVGLTPIGEWLRTDVPGSLAAFATFSGAEPYHAFEDLVTTVTTGETAFDHAYGQGHFDYLAHHPEASATFQRAMAGGIDGAGDPLEGFDLGTSRVLVDVGGGHGALLAAVLRAHPGLRGILYDLENAVVDAPAFLESAGVKDRCEIRTGSAFESIPSGGDLYVMSRILHDWPDERALGLLRNCRSVIPDGGALLLREVVLAEGIPPTARAELDLMMMAITGGRERTQKEWSELLHHAGFVLRRVWMKPPGQDLIEAGPDLSA
jgi:hypothetical protein